MLDRLIAAVKRNPVRTYLYGVAAALLALLVTVGVVDFETADGVLTLVGSVLLVAGTEKARSKVTPVR